MGQRLSEECGCCSTEDPDATTELDTTTCGATVESTSPLTSVPAAASAARGATGLAATVLSTVSFDLVLSDLETAEQLAYSQAFNRFDTHGTGCVPMDHEGLREFLLSNSAIDIEELDTELLKAGSLDDGGLRLDSFFVLLREHAIADTTAIEEFLGTSTDGVTASAQDCRNRLLLLGQRQLDAHFNEEQWDCIFNTVMMNADVVVPMEQFITYCNSTARIVRVAKCAKCAGA